MMKLPAYLHKQFPTGETVTVFQDDAEFWRFYLIPGFPTVRTDPGGNPVFQLTKFKLSDQSREENPELPRGGGYMVFDSELKVKANHQEELVKELQKHVRQEWNRLKDTPPSALRTLKLNATFNDQISEHWKKKKMMVGSPVVPSQPGSQPGSETPPQLSLEIPGPASVPVPVEEPKVLIGEPL